ncbi:MAG: Fic family protein [Spirochaetota bacterium]
MPAGIDPAGGGPVRYHDGAFPPRSIDWASLVPLIGPAAAAIARYDGLLSAIPNAAVLLSPLTTQEAILSSRIEGTQATMVEVLSYEAQAEAPDRREADIHEVLNYRKAMAEAEEMMKTIPLSQRVIREAHRVLLSGVRGQNKAPGEYRRNANWIGPPGCSIEEAHYVPIDAQKLPDAMSEWERYAHRKEQDTLVQMAVLHAEFEALHPFLDGNGRLGRMLIPLGMWQAGIIHRPMFYISAFFEADRDQYYERLQAVSRDGDWTGWCRYFLKAVETQAKENQTKAAAIIDLYNESLRMIPDIVRSQYTVHALNWIFTRPIFKSSDFVASAGIPSATAKRLLKVMEKERLLIVVARGGGRRAARLAFPSLINLAEGKNVF